MNTLFVNQYSDMKIKKTTMTPQIYYETDIETIDPVRIKGISDNNKSINDRLIKKTEDGEQLTYDDIKPSRYYVPKIKNVFSNTFPKDVFMTVYDVPGLNDGATKQLYMKYVDDNFYKFDIVVFIVSIQSGLNTSDEVEILEHVLNGIKRNKEKYDITTKLIVLVNKCDDMFIENGKVTMNEEFQEMFEQVNKILKAKIDDICPDMNSKITRAIPISCEDAYIYRMYQKDVNIKLDSRYVNKFGINEFGRTKWNKMEENDKHEQIKELMSKMDINERMELNGFKLFTKQISVLLNHENQYNYLINHMSFSLYDISEFTKLDISNKISKLFNVNSICKELDSEYGGSKACDVFQNHLNHLLNTYDTNIIEPHINKITIKNINQVEAILENVTTLKKYFDCDSIKILRLKITTKLSEYYSKNIKEHRFDFMTSISSLFTLVKLKYKNIKETIASVFNNNDINNQTSHTVLSFIQDLDKNNLIEPHEKINHLVFIINRFYESIYRGLEVEYIPRNYKNSFVYHSFNFWQNCDLTKFNNLHSDIDYKLLNNIKFYSYKNMVKFINQTDELNMNIDLSLEKALINLLNNLCQTNDNNTINITTKPIKEYIDEYNPNDHQSNYKTETLY